MRCPLHCRYDFKKAPQNNAAVSNEEVIVDDTRDNVKSVLEDGKGGGESDEEKELNKVRIILPKVQRPTSNWNLTSSK